MVTKKRLFLKRKVRAGKGKRIAYSMHARNSPRVSGTWTGFRKQFAQRRDAWEGSCWYLNL
jgi:hypothetical protein